MNLPMDHRGLAKQPQQQRSQDRFERILEVSEQLLLEAGLTDFSIPALAKELEWPRASIYKYFPTQYAIYNELAIRYLGKLEQLLARNAKRALEQSRPESVQTFVNTAARFYDANPVARLLILGGAATDEAFRAQELTIQHLGQIARELFARSGVILPQSPVDVAALAVDLGTTCFRLSFFKHKQITREYRDEAAYTMIAYLSRYFAKASKNGTKP